MNTTNVKQYWLSCFLLTIPILIWNVLFADQLPAAFKPEIFWKDIPVFLKAGEHTSRILVFMLTLIMPLQIRNTASRKGLIVYVIGTIVYFISWLILMFFPESVWSNSLPGFMAPAFTPLLWLIGIGLTGNSFLFGLRYKKGYFISLSVLFLLFHNYHTWMIYERIHQV